MFGKLAGLVAVLVLLLMLLVAPLVVTQQDVGGDPSEEGGSQTLPPDSALAAPVGADSDNLDASFSEYAPSNPDGGQAVPVCPGPAAPGTARCHSLVRTD